MNEEKLKNILLFIGIIALSAVVVYKLVELEKVSKESSAPIFKGPTAPPYVKGPTGPPPGPEK